jgi:hypothetical protein
MSWKLVLDKDGVTKNSADITKESLSSFFRGCPLDDQLLDCDGTADKNSFLGHLWDFFDSTDDWDCFCEGDIKLRVLDANLEPFLSVSCNEHDSFDYEFGLFKEEHVSKNDTLKYAPNEKTPPYLYILLARLIWDSYEYHSDLSKFSPYEILPAMAYLTSDCIFESSSYCIDDEETMDLFGKSFNLDVLEGSYQETIYEWIHLYLVKQDLYSLFLSESQLKAAIDVPDGFIYGPDSEVDDNADEVDCIISNLQNELILSCALVGVNYPDRLIIAPFAQYFEDCGMEDAMAILDQAIESKFSKG